MVKTNEAAEKSAAEEKMTPLQSLGAVTSVLLASPVHRHVFLNELDWMIVPPISLGQCHIFYHGTVPVAFATWAYLNEEVAERFRNGQGRLKPAEWNCGDQLWLVEVTAPYGGGDEMLQELKGHHFADQDVRMMRMKADGAGLEEELL